MQPVTGKSLCILALDMQEPRDRLLLLAVTDLPPGMCYGFDVAGRQPVEGFLINWQGEIHAYQNACPHTGVSLNWAPNQFFDIEQRFIQCGMHGALFEPASGLCIRGPCLGQALTRLPIQIIGGQVYLLTGVNC